MKNLACVFTQAHQVSARLLSVLVLSAWSFGVQAATVVNVQGQDYRVDIFTGTGFDNAALLKSQVFYSDPFLAIDFASALGASEGFPNFNSDAGPFFAYGVTPDAPGDFYEYVYWRPDGTISPGGTLEFDEATYATVTAVPVPAAVWLFGSALAGLGWMRRKQTA